MSAVQAWSLILLSAIIVLAAGAALGVLWARRSFDTLLMKVGAEAEADYRRELAEVLSRTRDDQPVRAEVIFSDFGIEYGEMRWRWTVWDADRVLAAETDTPVATIGTEVPLMLGNAPTKLQAYAEALTWVREEAGLDRIVVTEHDGPDPVVVFRIEDGGRLYVNGRRAPEDASLTIGFGPLDTLSRTVTYNGQSVPKARVYRFGVLMVDTTVEPVLEHPVNTTFRLAP